MQNESTTLTPAELEALRLRNLADHYVAHPGLVPVNVTHDLQVRTHRAEAEAPVAWADSMADVRGELRVLEYEGALLAFVYLHGRVGDRAERVWDTVPGLFEWLHSNGLLNPEAVHVDDFDLTLLRQFAEEVSAARSLVSTVDAEAVAS